MPTQPCVLKSSTKKNLFLLFTTIAIMFLLRGLDTDNDILINTNIQHHIHVQSADAIIVEIKPHSNRIAPLDPHNKFSFVHISKCAGATWIRLLKEFLNLKNVCPGSEAGPEHSVSYQQQYKCKDADYTLISLRSPRHHVWSQFTMCKYSQWGQRVTRNYTDFPRSGEGYQDDQVDFDSWLSHFVAMRNETNNHYNCYHPANFQSRALTTTRKKLHDGSGGVAPNLTLAMNTYNKLDFVALVEFVHESQCMLNYRLGDEAPPAALSYLSDSCHCEKQQDDHPNKQNIHVQHHSHGKRSKLRDLPVATLSKVANLTSADALVYVQALQNFMDEMAWLESDAVLGRRVVCDGALEKWEMELAYLDDGRFSVTELYRDAVKRRQHSSF